MAVIAEELLLLLLDNATATPVLAPVPRRRMVAAAVLLDLALLCRIRPSMPGDRAAEGRLVALAGPEPDDAALAPAFTLLGRNPMTATRAVSRLQRHAEAGVLAALESTGQVQRISALHGVAWPLCDRGRPDRTRTAMLSTLLGGTLPDPVTAAVISLLHFGDGLRTLLSLDQQAWQWAEDRAGQVSAGGWIASSSTDPPVAEVNLAVTIAALRPALT